VSGSTRGGIGKRHIVVDGATNVTICVSDIASVGRDVSVDRAVLCKTRTTNRDVAVRRIGVMRIRRIIGGEVVGAIFGIVTVDQPGGPRAH
jgi:hypothetical protein